MKDYEVDYTYRIAEYGTHVLQAENKEEAEQLTLEYVQDTFDQCFDINVDEVREVNR